MHEILEQVRKLRPIDDILFEKLVEDPAVCQELLRTILEDAELQVLSVTPQNSIRNLYGRSVRLDALCQLGNGELCNIEVQKSDNDNHAKRVRYNEACITANNTKVGDSFVHVPDVTMVYISTFDIFQGGKTIYHCRTVTEETHQALDNGLVEIYVNTEINDGTEISELMECFLQEQVNHKKFPCLSQRMHYFKNDEKGEQGMCDIVEQYAIKKSMEGIRNLFKNGVSMEQVLASFTSLSEEVITQIYEEVMNEKATTE